MPSTEDTNRIIARSSEKYATIFKLLAETGAMPVELHNVTPRDIDLERAASTFPAARLVDAGFEYVCDFDGAKIFRKRK